MRGCFIGLFLVISVGSFAQCDQLISDKLLVVLDAHKAFIADSALDACEFEKLQVSYTAYLKKEKNSLVATLNLGKAYREYVFYLYRIPKDEETDLRATADRKHIKSFEKKAQKYIDRAKEMAEI